MELIALLVAHHFGDVWTQPTWLIENKKKHLFAVFEHAVVYTGVISIAFMLVGRFDMEIFWWILIGHFLIDTEKYLVIPKMTGRSEYSWIYIDQALHYAQIMIAFYFL